MKKQKNRKFYKIGVGKNPLSKFCIWIHCKVRVFFWRMGKSYKYTYWLRFDKVINRLSFIALEYGRKNNGDIDKRKMPIIKYQFVNNIVRIKIQFKTLVTNNDYEKLLQIIKDNTNAIILDYRIDMGVCYIELGRTEDNKSYKVFVDEKEMYKIPIAFSYGFIVYWEFKKIPHMLVAGATGSGKSVFLTWLLSSLCRYYEVDLVDGKGTDFATSENLFNKYADYANINTPEKMYAIIFSFEEEIFERIATLKELGIKSIYHKKSPYKPRFLVIDELSLIIRKCSTEKERKKILGTMANISAVGRSLGMHLINAMQRTDAVYFGGGDARNNYGVRILLWNNEEESYKMMFDNKDIQVKYSDNERGHGILSVGNKLYRVCMPYIEEIETNT